MSGIELELSDEDKELKIKSFNEIDQYQPIQSTILDITYYNSL